MASHVSAIQPATTLLSWLGPYAWPGIPSQLGSLAPLGKTSETQRGGVYLMTVEYEAGGYIIFGVGITGRPFAKRFAEHRRSYLTGSYNILDTPSLRRGIRHQIWHGFWSEPRVGERAEEYARRRDELRNLALEQLRSTNIFVAHVDEPRLRARIEAGIMQILYSSAEPFRAIPDKGVHVEPRWRSESPITVRNQCPQVLNALPEMLSV